MTTAYEILATSRNSAEAMDAAAAVAAKTDQDWRTESTLYTFDDESVLVASGPQLNAYAGPVLPLYKVLADRTTGEWIGEPEYFSYVERIEWDVRTDTDEAHFDTYEVDDQTRAVEVIYDTRETE